MDRAILIILIVTLFAGCSIGDRPGFNRTPQRLPQESMRINKCREEVKKIFDRSKRKEHWVRCVYQYLELTNTTEDYTPDRNGYVNFTAKTLTGMAVISVPNFIEVKIDCGGQEVLMIPSDTDSVRKKNWRASCKVADSYYCGVDTPNRIVFKANWWTLTTPSENLNKDFVSAVNIPIYEGGEDDVWVFPEQGSNGITYVEDWGSGNEESLYLYNTGPGALEVEDIKLNCKNSTDEWIPCTDNSYAELLTDTTTLPYSLACANRFIIKIHIETWYKQVQLIIDTNKKDFNLIVEFVESPSG